MSSLVPFYPGSSPCDGNCSLEWAAESFGIPEGLIVPMTIPENSVIEKMSYSRDGKPFVSGKSYITVSEHHGVGYVLPNEKIMFRFEECQNWSLVTVFLPKERSVTDLVDRKIERSGTLSETTVLTNTVITYGTPIEIPKVPLAESMIYFVPDLLLLFGLGRIRA